MVTARRARTIEDEFMEYLQNNKLNREDEELRESIRQCYIMMGKEDEYNRIQDERRRKAERQAKWSRWADIIAFIVVVIIALYFHY